MKMRTRVTKPSLPSDFRNSAKPWTPNMPVPSLRKRDARGLRPKAFADELRVLEHRRPDAGHDQQDQQADQRFSDFEHDETGKRDDVMFGRQRPGVGPFKKQRQKHAEVD